MELIKQISLNTDPKLRSWKLSTAIIIFTAVFGFYNGFIGGMLYAFLIAQNSNHKNS